jgi:D-alanine-D-alanine ligase
MKLKDKKIAVLMGGISSERDISLKTGEAIYNALIRKGYNSVKIDIKENSLDFLKNRFDIAFIALHGKYGEDGVIQGILEFLKIPYTGTGVLGSSICMDKVLTKKLFQIYNIPTPEFSMNSDKLDMEFPVVIKPVAEGSTIGVYIAENMEQFKEGVLKARKISDNIFIEEFIKGREVTVGVVNGRVLPVIEIKPKKGFYDYEAKYNKGMTEYIVPAEINENIREELEKYSVSIYKNFKLKGAVRIDYIISDNIPYALEANTIPGMTETSLLPKAAKCIGLGFDDLVEEILRGI